MSARLQRAQYPFQEKTVTKLLRTIADLRDNLILATSTLQLDVSMTSLDRLDRVNINIEELIDKSMKSEDRDLMSWLSPLDFSSKQSDALSRRQEGTGRWLLESNEFRAWLETAGRVLWCPGMREQCFSGMNQRLDLNLADLI